MNGIPIAMQVTNIFDIKTIARNRAQGFPSLLDFYFRRRILGRKIPLIASFKLTYRCNLRCSGCPFHRRAHEAGAHMSWEGAITALDALQRLGTRIVVFEDGEPLLWRDGSHHVRDLVDYARSRFFRVAATTNGTLPLDLPVHILWVSLDGLKETHDRLRSDSFDRAWANLQATEHPRVMVHITVNRENWKELEGLLEKIGELPAVRGVTVQFFYPYEQGEEPLALSPRERKAAIEMIIALKKRGYPIANSTGRLRGMIENNWRCHDDILVNVDPDGTITRGCYVKNRGAVHCQNCGFTPVAEASGALDLNPGAILVGWRIFLR